MSQRVVVVGAGHAAGEFCAALVHEPFDGTITVLGEEPHPPYQRPPLSKAYLTGNLARERLFLRDPDFYATHDIAVKTDTTVTAIDRTAKTVATNAGETVPYDSLVLLTGARVRQLTCPGADLPGVRYLRNIADTDEISAALQPGQSMVVIGGGYIGLEVAASARKLGLDVTVLEQMPRLLARVASEDLSADVEALHKSEGVDVRLGAAVTDILGDDHVSGVKLDDGTTLAADHVIVGIGIVPNDEIATAAGLETNNGIVVDATGRTSDPTILAAGDVARFDHPSYGSIRLESVQNAVEQAKACAETVRGADVSYCPVPWFWSDQYGAKIQLAGLVNGYDQIVRRPGKREGASSLWLYRDGAFLAVESWNDPPSYMLGKRWLEEGKTPSPERVANPEINIKEIV